jgi:hypothetical protein
MFANAPNRARCLSAGVPHLLQNQQVSHESHLALNVPPGGRRSFMRTVIGVLPSVAQAERVVHDFEVLGIAKKEISVVPPIADPHELKKVERSKRGNAAAAAAGAVRGVILGFVLGGLMLSAPGVKPFLAGGVTATLLAGCAIVGFLMSMMTMVSNMGRSHEEAPLHEEAVHEKGVVVSAHVNRTTERAALDALTKNGARDVHASADVSHVSR